MRSVTESCELDRDRHGDRDRGAIVVTVALTMTLLLAVGALVIDVGAVYAERRILQNAADAAVLALTTECASALTGCGSHPQAFAEEWVAKNANGRTITVTVCGGGNASATLPACDDEPPSNATDGSGWVKVIATSHVDFSMIPGGSDVTREAIAAWGGLNTMNVLPLMLSQCVWEDAGGNLDTGAIPPEGEVVTFVGLDAPDACVPRTGDRKGKTSAPREFGWIYSSIKNDCDMVVTVGQTYRGDKTGEIKGDLRDAKKCKSLQVMMQDKTLIVPVFDTGIWGKNCVNPKDGKLRDCWTYEVAGFVAFHITGYDFNDEKDLNKHDVTWPIGLNCRGTGTRVGTDICVQGYFERVVSGGDFGQAPDYGARVVKMIG